MHQLITGATGFIGQALAEALVADGESVRLFVRDRSRLAPSLRGLDIVEGDLGHPGSLEAAVRGVDTVYHCAANVRTWDTDAAYRQANVDGVRNLVEALRRETPQLQRLVHVSTVDVYGFPPTPCDENCPLDGAGFGYGQSKLEGERLVRDSGLPYTILRPTNVIGPGSPFVSRIGDALRNGVMLLIDGGRSNAGVLYIDNLVRYLAWAATASAAINETFNVRDPSDITWSDFVCALREALRDSGRGRIVDLPYPVAEAVARLMELGHRLVPGSREPVLHRLLVRIFGRTCGHDSGKIRALSRLDGGIEFGEGLERSVAWYLGQAR